MATWKKWALGIAIIVAAIAGAVIKVLDDNPDTKVDIPGTVQEVNTGIETIKDGAK